MKNNKLLLLIFGIGLFSQIIFSQVPSYVPTNGLVGYWPFNGNANDESGNGHNGTVNGATLTTDRFGVANKAYDFNGISNYIMLSKLSNLNSISISAWELVPPNDKGVIVAQNDPSNCTNVNFYLDFGYSTNNYISIGHNPNCSSAGVTTWSNSAGNYYSNWHHLVGVINQNGTSKLYVDGVLKFTNNTVSTFNSLCSTTNSSLRFGGLWWNGDPNYLLGKLDDIGIWNRELTQDEITSLYYSENTCQSLVINTGVLSFNPPTYNNTITIYPNPANDHITIDCGNLSNVSGWTIKIVNTLGQEVFSGAMNTQQYIVPLNSWGGQGVYLVKVYDASNNLLNTKKIILQ